MIYVGIDVSKDKHDCTIVSSDGVVLADVFTIQNNLDGFNLLFQRIKSVAPYLAKVKVGLEATGHYSYNILGFLLDKGLHTFVINPLHTNLFRKSTSLRRTKTDRVDARTIAAMMMSGVVLKSYDHEQRENQCCQSLFMVIPPVVYRFCVLLRSLPSFRQYAAFASYISRKVGASRKTTTTRLDAGCGCRYTDIMSSGCPAYASVSRLKGCCGWSSRRRMKWR